MKELKAKTWGKACVLLFGILIVSMMAVTIAVDPYFHYHKPLSCIRYRLYEQRYINDGIGRQFEYDAIITGNSLTENFKTSQADELFLVNSIKLPFSGAGYREIWGNLSRTLNRRSGIKMVFSVLDYDDLIRESDYMRYEDYPEYLYDDSFLNDVSYLLNKDVFYRGTFFNLYMTLTGQKSTTFDEYSSWQYGTGAGKVLTNLDRVFEADQIKIKEFTKEDENRVRENIRFNIAAAAEQYPDTEFYLCFGPVSIAQWAQWYNFGQVQYRIAAEQTALEELLQYDNIHISCFYEKYDWICNLDNYSDMIHFTPQINSEILRYMKTGEYELTKDHYRNHIKTMQEFYGSFDYQSLMDDKEKE